jgi:hypothetical protein
MNAHKKTARMIGTLYIIGTMAGILSVTFTDPIRSAQDSLLSIAAHENQIIIGALFVLTMGLSLAIVPIIVFPILRKHTEVVALGYIIFRSGLETVTYITIAFSWLLLLPLSRVYHAGTPDAANILTMGNILLEAQQIISIGTIVFIIGALMFYYVLYNSKLIPRWLSGWGLLATVPYLTAGLLGMFGIISAAMSSTSIIHSVMVLPLGVQEMVLAVWLIIKGFN